MNKWIAAMTVAGIVDVLILVAVVVIIFSTIDLHYKYEALNSQFRASIENSNEY